jgi:DNA ligase D-like protein (predicted polymerase)
VPDGDHVDVEVSGRTVRVTSPGKVMFPERGETKLDLVRYYLAVEEPLLRAMGGRPTLMQRFPNGVGGSSFFQKRVPEDAPEWLETTIVSTPNGTTSRALVAADLAHIVWAVNLGCLGFHVWPNLASDASHADELRLDLDPQPGVGFDEVRTAAREVRALLDELGIEGRPKTTGNRGIHVYVRLEPRWDPVQVRAAAVAAARELARRRPDVITDAWWKEERGERVFVDFNQNAPHKTVFGAWSARARPGAQVSTPFEWDELDAIHPDELTIATVPDRVARAGDPWAGIDVHPQTLEPLLDMSARDLASGLQDAPWPPVYPKMPGEPPRVAPSRARKPDADGAPAKKTAKKTAAKTAKQAAKRTTRKAAEQPAKKPTKEPVKKTTGKAVKKATSPAEPPAEPSGRRRFPGERHA